MTPRDKRISRPASTGKPEPSPASVEAWNRMAQYLRYWRSDEAVRVLQDVRGESPGAAPGGYWYVCWRLGGWINRAFERLHLEPPPGCTARIFYDLPGTLDYVRSIAAGEDPAPWPHDPCEALRAAQTEDDYQPAEPVERPAPAKRRSQAEVLAELGIASWDELPDLAAACRRVATLDTVAGWDPIAAARAARRSDQQAHLEPVLSI